MTPRDWPSVLAKVRQIDAHYSMSEEEQELLYRLACGLPPGATVVELGVCHGKTAAVLISAVEAGGGIYHGVDNWSLEGDAWKVGKALKSLGFLECWSLWAGDTREVYLPIEAIDLLLIDAGHDEANVSADIDRWVPLVKPGGLVVFDDYPGESTWRRSPHWAVREYADRATGSWDLVAFWGKMLVRRRPA